jgi:hypothetical protein
MHLSRRPLWRRGAGYASTRGVSGEQKAPVLANEGIRRVSPETIAVGVFSIVGTLLGVVAGLFGERWVRSWGEVRCEIADWRINVGTSAGPEESQLEVRFLNEKELPIVVWELRGSVNRRVAYVSRHDGKAIESL